MGFLYMLLVKSQWQAVNAAEQHEMTHDLNLKTNNLHFSAKIGCL